MNKKIVIAITLLAASLGGLSACASADDADVVSENISKAADNFEIARRVVMLNGITDEYLLVIEGLCNISVDEAESQLEVTCLVEDAKKDKDKQYKKHFLGLSDNVTYFVEQGESVNVSANHYRVTFKPQSIIPDVDFRGSAEDTPLSEQNQQ